MTTLEQQPAWITQPLTPYDVAAINQGGCASGAYMPAVTYHSASQTMSEHGDDVLEYIDDCYGEIPQPPSSVETWSQMASFYLAMAVELYALGLEDYADWDDDQTVLGEVA